MGAETQKTGKSTTVRIYEEKKARLQKVARRKADQEDREVTEIELVDKALTDFLAHEEPKLGIKPKKTIKA